MIVGWSWIGYQTRDLTIELLNMFLPYQASTQFFLLLIPINNWSFIPLLTIMANNLATPTP